MRLLRAMRESAEDFVLLGPLACFYVIVMFAIPAFLFLTPITAMLAMLVSGVNAAHQWNGENFFVVAVPLFVAYYVMIFIQDVRSRMMN